MVFHYQDKVSPGSGIALFFNAFQVSGLNGATTISAFSRFSDHGSHLAPDLMESLRQMLALPSRSELMRDLQDKNRDLSESAEKIRAAKDAAEQASLSLQQRVGELAQARYAMLNIMEDLAQSNEDLETAHRQILDSIQYASRIQRAVLPGDSLVRQVLPQCVVVWEPRDVVGGDIYWCRPWGEGHLLILGDCTGHGVPGAFMTLIANGALDQAMQKAIPGDAADLLGHMHRLMQAWLGQDTDQGASDDGIEIGVCYLPPGRERIVFAGARFTLFQVDGEGVTEIVGDKKGIGYRAVPHEASFGNKLVKVLPGSRFFLTTDGMIDQVGGEKRRGYGKKRFCKFIVSLKDVPLHDQGKHFLKELRDYQGAEKRRDDVSIIGFALDPAWE
jgi:serine phosphatase RsbU (regulator of sigma subunit)